MKRLYCLICAVLLVMFTVLPVSAVLANPDDSVQTENITVVENAGTSDPLAATEPGEIPDETMMLFATEPATEPETTAQTQSELYLARDFMPAAENAPDPLTPVLTYAALGLSIFALLLAVIAMVRSGKKSSNATGNYKKYF